MGIEQKFSLEEVIALAGKVDPAAWKTTCVFWDDDDGTRQDEFAGMAGYQVKVRFVVLIKPGAEEGKATNISVRSEELTLAEYRNDPRIDECYESVIERKKQVDAAARESNLSRIDLVVERVKALLAP